MFGVVPVVLDAEGQVITETECSGYLAIQVRIVARGRVGRVG